MESLVNYAQPKICMTFRHAWTRGLLVSGVLLVISVGTGVAADIATLRRKAEAGDAAAQYELGRAYDKGKGVEEDEVEASRWYSRAGRQGHKKALYELGSQHFFGAGDVPFDRVRSYAYWDLAAARGHSFARFRRNALSRFLTAGQVASATIIGQQFMAGGAGGVGVPGKVSGTAFFITSNGYLATNEHVVRKAVKLTAVQGKNKWPVKVIAVDTKNDLAILKIDGGGFPVLPIAASRSARLGLNILVIGFPVPNAVGTDPTLTKGIINKMSGFQGAKSQFQVSAPIQNGSSGSPLLNEKRQVIGVITSSLVGANRRKDDPNQNANFAVKSDLLMILIKKHPEVFQSLLPVNPAAKENFDAAVQAGVAATVRLETERE